MPKYQGFSHGARCTLLHQKSSFFFPCFSIEADLLLSWSRTIFCVKLTIAFLVFCSSVCDSMIFKLSCSICHLFYLKVNQNFHLNFVAHMLFLFDISFWEVWGLTVQYFEKISKPLRTKVYFLTLCFVYAGKKQT